MGKYTNSEQNSLHSDTGQEGGRESAPSSSPEVSPAGELPTPEDPETELSILKKELQEKLDECQALNEKYLRLYAEFENFKRRAQRERTEAIRFGNEQLLKDLLSIIDNLERAIQCGKEQSQGAGLLEGIELTHKQFLDVLKKLGVSQITSVGEPFDPARHQAVARVESSTAEANSVVEEFQKGYVFHDRILRPSMVTVATSPTDDTTTATEDAHRHNEGEQA